MEKITPSLIENSTKFYLRTALKESRNIKNKYITIGVNIFLFILFIIVIVGFLLYKYKGKLTPSEIIEKNNEKHHYILEKIKNYQIAKQRSQQALITGLPHWENEYNSLYSKPNYI